MSIFETRSIYAANPEDHCLDFRKGTVIPVDNNVVPDYLSTPFYVSGIRRHDLAVFATALTIDGAQDFSYLVTSSSQNQGLLVTDDFLRLAISTNSKAAVRYLTPELAKKFATLKSEEINQLGIDDIASECKKKYPNIRGFYK